MRRNAISNDQVLTSRGAATRQRILAAAARLIYAAGAERVSLDDVMEACSVSKSQLYHYFGSKDALIREVIDLQTSRILEANAAHLDHLDGWDALRTWRNAMVSANAAHGQVGGCPVGSLANELAARSDAARHQLDGSFVAWAKVIETALSRMRDRGALQSAADPKALSLAMLAAIQGGILLSKTARNSQPLRLALDMAFSHLERFAA